MRRSLLILDIDGVLRSWPPPCPTYTNAAGRKVLSYAPEAVAALNWLLDKTAARLVISSTWRSLGTRRLQEALMDWGVRYPIYSMLRPDTWATPGTPAWDANDRSVQLADWLTLYRQRHPQESLRVVILDDEETQHPECLLIQTDIVKGLTWEQARQGMAYLQGSERWGSVT